MRLQLTLVLVTLLSASNSPATRTPPARPSAQLAGTYSNLTYNEESGDLLGLEVKIVPVVGERYQAAVLTSNGEPQPMHVVEVHVSGGTVSFAVREDDATSWSFRGTVSAQSLKGTITHSLGGREAVTLRRRCGYWDR